MLQNIRSSSVAPRRAGALPVIVLVAGLAAVSSFQGCGGGGGQNGLTDDALNAVLHWNQVATDAAATDPTNAPSDQLGPCRTARALAIVHIAMFETLIAASGGHFQSILNLPHPSAPTSIHAAVGQAAHDTLVIMYPQQTSELDTELMNWLATDYDLPRRDQGVLLGQSAASGILAMRFNDGSQVPETTYAAYFTAMSPGINNPGVWRQDPVSMIDLALGYHWPQVLPFALNSASQFRAPAPPALNSAAYATAYNEVMGIGGDGITTASTRTPDQSVAAIYWGYDGTPNIGFPPRLYNQIAVLVGRQQGLGGIDLARLLALVNVAMADSSIACWESKYFYQTWRPVTGIRESDPGTGPTGLGDGNAATTGDVNWTPLGAPSSNPASPPSVNFTPPFPSYPSGHAGFGGAIFQVFRRFFGTDTIPFTFVSDEFNGVTQDNLGLVRPLIPRTFSTFTQAEDENGQSRVYLGIHWAFDKTAGITMGNSVGDWTFDHLYQPIP
jgi:hypothetical protein